MVVKAFSPKELENITLVDETTLFDKDGTILPVPSSFYDQYMRESLMLFGHQRALYSFPTVEVVQMIKEMINGREAETIEIGAGNGGWCKALGIRGTDSHQQSKPHIKTIYTLSGQPTIQYGEHVEEIDGLGAVRKYKPKIVVAAWVTHRFNTQRAALGGNAEGVDEFRLLSMIDEYIFIGNSKVHNAKPIFIDHLRGDLKEWDLKLTTSDEDRHIYSRASGGYDFIAHYIRKK